MCLVPSLLPNGKEVACRLCWQCRERKVNDWVGRCIAESKTATATHSVTLTYGQGEDGDEDHLRAKVLTYSDVQKYFKLLRFNGYPVRYFAVGEYGSTKGRAHWHLILFWQDKVPEHELNVRFNEKHWPHGVSFWEKPSPASIRYVCKYIQKDMGKDERQGHLAMSKIPPLGGEYFRRHALKYIDQGLAPQTLEYSFDEARNRDGKKTRFIMFGATAEQFLGHFISGWEARYEAKRWPNSELVDEWWEAQALPETELRLEKPGKVVRRPKGDDLYWWMKRERLLFNEKLNVWYYDFEYDQTPWYWVLNDEGEPEWRASLDVGARPMTGNKTHGGDLLPIKARHQARQTDTRR